MMQAFHTADQGYYPQTQYVQPQATYYGQYMAYHPYQSQQPPVIPPYPGPVHYDPPAQYPTPHPRRRKLSRGASAPSVHSVPSRSGTPAPPPLKSAMKRPLERSTSNVTVPLSRQTTSESRQRANSLTRQRSKSQQVPAPDHLFLAFRSSNEIRIDNIAYQTTLDTLRERILPMWPHGVAYEDSHKGWVVQFTGSPWTSTGADAILAQRLICRLYLVLAHEGYSHLTTVQTTNSRKPPRMVFVESGPDRDALIFMTTFVPSRLRLSLLDAPPEVAPQLANSLKAAFPRRVQFLGANEDGIYVIEVKKVGFSVSETERNCFLACMLQFFKSAGFKLDGSVPLGRRGRLGFGVRRETWVFRGTIPKRPESRQK